MPSYRCQDFVRIPGQTIGKDEEEKQELYRMDEVCRTEDSVALKT